MLEDRLIGFDHADDPECKMLIAVPAVMVWFVHAALSVCGRRRTPLFLVLIGGIPLLCVMDYLALRLVWHPTERIAEGDPRIDRLVIALFVGLAIWVAVVVLEPLLLVINRLVARLRALRSAGHS